MKEVIDFLKELSLNNNRDWFEAHRPDYLRAKEIFDAFALELIESVASFDPSVAGLGLRDCTYRIYRDTRFSKDKQPYKTHMGVYVCRGGKKSGYAGYYFHIEPSVNGMLGGNLMTSGIYMPEPVVLKSIREEIFDHGREIEREIKKAKGFELDTSNKLKRLPAGYHSGTPYEEYLKHKDFYIVKYIDNDWLMSPDLAKAAAVEYKNTLPFIERMNRAVEFAREEM